jgi:hypothetical protein
MAQINLTVKERLIFSGTLPREGNFLQQVVVRDLLKKVELSKQEQTDIELTFMPNGNLTWKEELAKDMTVTLENPEVSLLKSSFDNLEKGNKITQDNLSLMEKIKAL